MSYVENVVSFSLEERLCLIQQVNALPAVQFGELVFALGAPNEIMPDFSAPQGIRSAALFKWAQEKGGCGIQAVQEALDMIVKSIGIKDEKTISFTIQGNMTYSSSNLSEIKEAIEDLKRRFGDDIDFRMAIKGSIKIIAGASSEVAEKLKSLSKSGGLDDILRGIHMQEVSFVGSDTLEFKKSQLIKILRFREKTIAGHLALSNDFHLSHARDFCHQLSLDLLSEKHISSDIVEYSSKIVMIDNTLDKAIERGRDRAEILYRKGNSAIKRAHALAGTLPKIKPILNDIACNLIDSLSLIFSMRKRRYAPLVYGIALVLFRIQNIAFDLEIEFDFNNCTLGSKFARNSVLEWLNLTTPALVKTIDLKGGNLSDLVLGWLDLSGFDVKKSFVKDSVFHNDMERVNILEADFSDLSGAFQKLPFTSSVALLSASDLHEINSQEQETQLVSPIPEKEIELVLPSASPEIN